MTSSRCKDFVTWCEVQNRFYDGDVWGQHCCDYLFSEEPLFTSYGVCYVTKERTKEYFAFQFNAIEIWTNMDNVPGPSKGNKSIQSLFEIILKRSFFFRLPATVQRSQFCKQRRVILCHFSAKGGYCRYNGKRQCYRSKRNL